MNKKSGFKQKYFHIGNWWHLWMTEQILEVLGKLDERNTQSIIWVTLEQAKLIIYSCITLILTLFPNKKVHVLKRS